MSPSTPTAGTADDLDFDLDVVVVRSAAWPSGAGDSGRHCHSNDGCGHTCDSACAASCTDGDD
ncbi:FxLD family lantipeptide [Actinokineospora fastidiosa]|uniref:FxLD family lantipeptide n=1 Tax=Actinokineospora fastidiosa TaxID=1816 RepID=UPI0016701919|nr:FxLD family lantipeptide [Actinokineospora fastidiosa]